MSTEPLATLADCGVHSAGGMDRAREMIGRDCNDIASVDKSVEMKCNLQ